MTTDRGPPPGRDWILDADAARPVLYVLRSRVPLEGRKLAPAEIEHLREYSIDPHESWRVMPVKGEIWPAALMAEQLDGLPISTFVKVGMVR